MKHISHQKTPTPLIIKMKKNNEQKILTQYENRLKMTSELTKTVSDRKYLSVRNIYSCNKTSINDMQQIK